MRGDRWSYELGTCNLLAALQCTVRRVIVHRDVKYVTVSSIVMNEECAVSVGDAPPVAVVAASLAVAVCRKYF